jgi:VWFA-related protein
MRNSIPLALVCLLLVSFPAATQSPEGIAYRVEILPGGVQTFYRTEKGKRTLHVSAQFRLTGKQDGKVVTDVARENIVVKEDGKPVASVEIFPPAIQNLTTVLAIDTSGSMKSKPHGGESKMEEARKAANTFLDRLDPRADTGLILFNHELHTIEALAGDPNRMAAHRQRLRQRIASAVPRGGTAYLDATARAVEMLRNTRGRRAVLVLTDGQDMNSSRTLAQVIEQAQIAEVPVYTLGIGEPGKSEQVSSVLVLDHSGSMRDRASSSDQLRKIEALHQAASRFVDLIRPNAQTTLLPFSSEVESPRPFSQDKEFLKRQIRDLKPSGRTKLYDAAFAGIETLVAENPRGRKAVVILTDGRDVDSRRRPEAVIHRAQEAGIPLYTLGFGRPDDVQEDILREMAEQTGGTYHHADTQQRLFEIFEDLSIQLHDDGIDEEGLKKLANETGGKYFPARDVSKLQLLYAQLAEELQTTYTVIFPSWRSKDDGTARKVDISVERNGVRVSEVASADYVRPGLVVSEMSLWVYLPLLVILLGLIALPEGLRRLTRSATTP